MSTGPSADFKNFISYTVQNIIFDNTNNAFMAMINSGTKGNTFSSMQSSSPIKQRYTENS
jgi:hypothetical protein